MSRVETLSGEGILGEGGREGKRGSRGRREKEKVEREEEETSSDNTILWIDIAAAVYMHAPCTYIHIIINRCMHIQLYIVLYGACTGHVLTD